MLCFQLAQLHGFGYEAILLYNTNSKKKPETHMLVHDGGKAAQFAKTEGGMKYKNLFGNWIKNGRY